MEYAWIIIVIAVLIFLALLRGGLRKRKIARQEREERTKWRRRFNEELLSLENLISKRHREGHSGNITAILRFYQDNQPPGPNYRGSAGIHMEGLEDLLNSLDMEKEVAPFVLDGWWREESRTYVADKIWKSISEMMIRHAIVLDSDPGSSQTPDWLKHAIQKLAMDYGNDMAACVLMSTKWGMKYLLQIHSNEIFPDIRTTRRVHDILFHLSLYLEGGSCSAPSAPYSMSWDEDGYPIYRLKSE